MWFFTDVICTVEHALIRIFIKDPSFIHCCFSIRHAFEHSRDPSTATNTRIPAGFFTSDLTARCSYMRRCTIIVDDSSINLCFAKNMSKQAKQTIFECILSSVSSTSLLVICGHTHQFGNRYSVTLVTKNEEQNCDKSLCH